MTLSTNTALLPPRRAIVTMLIAFRSLLSVVIVLTLLPIAAHAQGTDPNTIAQNIQTFMTGPWGKSIASVAFGCVGLVAWWGYMSWATAARAVLGGVCLFSAPWFVQTFFGQ